MKRHGVGIVGAGFGRSLQASAWKLDSRVELISICGSSPSKTLEAAQALGVQPLSFEEQLRSPQISILSFAVPPEVQEEYLPLAIAAGKHVFCEKPVGATLEGSRTALELAEKQRICHGLDLFFPELAAWKAAPNAIREIGALSHIHLSWHIESRAFREGNSSSWKLIASRGGGTSANLGAHSMHYLELLFGPIRRLSASRGESERGATAAEAHIEMLLEFASGVPCTVTLAADAFHGTGHRLEVFGEKGRMLLANNSGDFARGFTLDLALRGSSAPERIVDAELSDGSDGRLKPISHLMTRFIDSIESQQRMTPSLREGYRIQQLLNVVQRAVTEQQWIEVAP